MKQPSFTGGTPDISVIIPLYNTKEYIQETLNSICSQTFCKLEIIVVNDGSTDGGEKIVQQMAEKDLRILLIHQENSGLSMTRNKALKEAHGRYIYFMDSDDLLEADALENCFKLCEAEQLDFVTFDAQCFTTPPAPVTTALRYDRSQSLYENTVYGGLTALKQQIRDNCYTPSCCLYLARRDFMQNLKLTFYPGIVHEDQLFSTLLYLQARRLMYINRKFFKRRIRSGSIMTRHFAWRNIGGYLTVTRELLHFARTASPDVNETIHYFLSQMLDAAVWEAHRLPLSQRIRLLTICLVKYKKFVSLHTLAVLMLKRKNKS